MYNFNIVIIIIVDIDVYDTKYKKNVKTFYVLTTFKITIYTLTLAGERTIRSSPHKAVTGYDDTCNIIDAEASRLSPPPSSSLVEKKNGPFAGDHS